MSTKIQIRLYHISSIVIAGLTAALFVNLLTYYGPRIEGFIWPVAASTDTTIVVLPEQGKIEVAGVMNKYRNCDLIISVAYVSDAAGNRVIARIEPIGNIKLRPVEKNATWGPWRVDVPVWFRKAWLSVQTVHQCHPLWETRSEFFNVRIE